MKPTKYQGGGADSGSAVVDCLGNDNERGGQGFRAASASGISADAALFRILKALLEPPDVVVAGINADLMVGSRLLSFAFVERIGF